MAASDNKPTVLLISIEEEDFHYELMNQILLAITSKARTLKASSKEKAISALSKHYPHAVLVTDAGPMSKKNRDLARILTIYMKGGGILLFGGAVSSFVTPPELNKAMKEVWDLPWGFGDYTRIDSKLSDSAARSIMDEHQMASSNMPKSINVKAVHLRDVATRDNVYTSEHAGGQACVAMADVGKGKLGWIGDVNYEEETIPIYLALLKLDIA